MRAEDRTMIFSASLLMLIVFNYLAWLLGAGDLVRHVILGMSALCIALIIYQRIALHDFLLPLVLLTILLIEVSYPVMVWDARSIWFFHAKRMFYDGSVYARLDNYFPYSHNDYPDIVPSFAASIARAAHLWNEVLPRLAVFVVLVPPVCLLLSELSTVSRVIAVGWTVYNLREMLLNGYMDGILALYVAVLAVHTCGMLASAAMESRQLSWREMGISSLLLAVITGLKNEGIVIGILFVACFTAILAFRKLPLVKIIQSAGVLLPAFIPIAIWKIHLAIGGVNNDLLHSGTPWREQLLDRVNLYSMALIFIFMLAGCPLFIVSLIGYASTYAVPRGGLTKLFVFLFLSSYYAALFFIYMVTPNGFIWQLRTSVGRVMMPITLTYFLFSLWFFQEYVFARRMKSCARLEG